MTRPAEEPGTPLEPTGNGRPREMVTHDRIRLTGLLRKSPGNGAFPFPNPGSLDDDDHQVLRGGPTTSPCPARSAGN